MDLAEACIAVLTFKAEHALCSGSQVTSLSSFMENVHVKVFFMNLPSSLLLF